MAENPAMQLLLMPGIGADYRVYIEQRKRFPGAVVPTWPTTEIPMDVSQYAGQCWAAWTLGSARVFDPTQPFVLSGCSIGSLVAMEVALLASSLGFPPKAVLIIGGCRTWNAVPAWYSRWYSWSERLPRWVASKMFLNRHFGLPKRTERLCVEHSKLLDSMFRSADWQQLRAFAGMMARWRRDEVEISAAPFPIHQIHGRLDHLLTVPSAKKATLLLDAGQYLCLTHETAVNNWIAAIISDLQLHHRPVS